MKKTTIFLLSVALALATVLLLAACADDCEKLGHDWGEPNVESAATCATDGKYTLTCKRCGESEQHALPATGEHDFGELYQAIQPTCVADGRVAYYYCADCKQYFDENHILLGNSAEDVVEHATGKHNFEAGAITKQPTCTEKGLQTYECSMCHKQESRTLDEIEHNYGNLHQAAEPTCVRNGNVAYYQCAVCKKYFDSAKSPMESVTRPATGQHVWNTESESVRWIWADTYAEFLENGVKAELQCVNCDAKTQFEATLSKDTTRSVEPTHTRQGSYAFTAEVTVGGVTVTDATGRVYNDVPVLPDGRPSEDYLLVGDFDGENVSKPMSWNIEEQSFEIVQTFKMYDVWSIASDSGANLQFSADDLHVTFDDGIDEPPTDLCNVIFNEVVCVRVRYDCVLHIKVDLAGKITLLVKEVTVRNEEFWFVPSGDAPSDDAKYKFVKQADGTFTQTIVIEKSEEMLFKFSYCGVELGSDAFADGEFIIDPQGEVYVYPYIDGRFMVMEACTIHVTFDPAAHKLTIIVY